MTKLKFYAKLCNRGEIMLGEKCILYDRDCIECWECEACDLNPSKRCDSCGKCLEPDKNYKIIKIDKIISENTEK